MAECAVSWTEDLMVGSSIPAVAQGYLIFPAQKDERHQEQLHSPGVERLNVWQKQYNFKINIWSILEKNLTKQIIILHKNSKKIRLFKIKFRYRFGLNLITRFVHI